MLTVNFQSRTPVYQQLYDDVVRLVSMGVLKSHTKLPPVRTLAAELGINPNTVSKAYKMLESDGYIYSTVGRGSFISEQLGQNQAAKIQAEKDLRETIQVAYKHGISKENVLKIVQEIYEEDKT
ncbi:MAG: GntR family transcriptional regulator [Eubacterium sp.]|nr:GntR family transcriptional regulator [Eubacterium sp.]